MPIEHQRLYVGCEQIQEVIDRLREWKTACHDAGKHEKADAYAMSIGKLKDLIKE